MRRSRLAGVLIGIVLSACAATQLRIDSERDPSVDLSRYHTYDWTIGAKPASTEQARLLDLRIRAAVEDGLAAKGFLRRSGAPDFLVGYRISISEVTVDTFEDLSSYRQSGGSANLGDVFTGGYEQGTLTLEVIDAARRRVVWHAAAKSALDQAQSRDRLDQAIAEMLDRFPSH